MLAPLHSVIDKWEYEKYLFFSLYENTEIHSWQLAPLGSVSQWKGDYASFSVLSNNLQNDLSKSIASILQ